MTNKKTEAWGSIRISPDDESGAGMHQCEEADLLFLSKETMSDSWRKL